jgi:uncharacterized membrane protein
MNELREEIMSALTDMWQKHRAPSLGLLAGVLLGMCILLFGFWHILFIVLCGGLGLYIGRKVQAGESLLPAAWDRFTRRFDHFR